MSVLANFPSPSIRVRHLVLCRDMCAVAGVNFHKCARAFKPAADAQCRSSTAERVQDVLAGRRCQFDAPLHEPFVELRLMPLTALLGISDDASEIVNVIVGDRHYQFFIDPIAPKSVSWHSTSWISPLVAMLLPPRLDTNGIRIQGAVTPADTDQWSVVIAEIMVVVLTEGENLDARLDLNVLAELSLKFSDDASDLAPPLSIVTEPDAT